MSTNILPFHYINTLTGTKSARLIEDPGEYAHYVKMANRPLLVIGGRALTMKIGDQPVIGYAVEISKTLNIPICATAHTAKKLLEMGVEPASRLDIIEIINMLKDRDWKGVKGEGNHDLVLFLGIRADLAEQGLSTLKHFAPHLKTMTLCKYYYPNAAYSLNNYRKDDNWKKFLDDLIAELNKKEA
jgi:anaerobic carbon-monoxide dehydrogenase, CODH/ACS complex subunit epsilon